MTVAPEFVFLPGDGESANDLLARYEEELLAAGPMGWYERPDAMREFLSSTFTNGAGLWHIKGTTCALFQGGCLIGSGVQERRPSPTRFGITTWLQASWFSGAEWISVEKLLANEESLLRGDIVYWCSGPGLEPAHKWQAARNGHVGCVRQGYGFTWSTAEGGGADGLCRLSDGPKDITTSFHRHLRGAWRPNLMAATVRNGAE